MTLHEDIGGEDAIAAVVDDFYDRVLADESLAPHFEGTSMDELRDHQRQFLGMVTGGPVEYSGADMRAAHRHLALSDDDFDAVAGHLDAALRDNGVADDHVAAILDEVESLRDDVLDR
jgi:hemoglobin